MSAAGNLHATAVRIRALPRRGLIEVAKAAKRDAVDVGARMGAPLVGKKRRGMKLRAFDTIRDSADGASLRIQGVNPAGWVWVTDGTAPHQIRRRKRGREAKMTVHHPGTAGRGAWIAVTRKTEQTVPRVFAEQARRAIGA